MPNRHCPGKPRKSSTWPSRSSAPTSIGFKRSAFGAPSWVSQVPGNTLELINAPRDPARIPQRHRRARHTQNLRQIRLRDPDPRRLETDVARHNACQRLLPHRPAGRPRRRIIERRPLPPFPSLLEVLATAPALRASRVVHVAVRTPSWRRPHPIHRPLLPQVSSRARQPRPTPGHRVPMAGEAATEQDPGCGQSALGGTSSTSVVPGNRAGSAKNAKRLRAGCGIGRKWAAAPPPLRRRRRCGAR